MTLDIDNSIFRVYEEYVLKDKNLEEGAKGLINTSDDYRYLKCMELLAKKDLKKEELEYIKKYMKNNRSSREKKIGIRYLMLEYEAAKSKEDKDKVLDKISKDILDLRFHHQKPGNLGFKVKEEVKKKGQERLLDSVNAKDYLEKLYLSQNNPKDFSKQAILQADLEKINKSNFFEVLKFLGKDLPMFDNSKLCDVLVKHIKDSYNKDSGSYNFDESIFDHMTLDQLENLKKKISDLSKNRAFIESCFKKKFAEELYNPENSGRSDEEKRNDLIKIYEYAKSSLQKFPELRSCILLELLHNGVKLNKYDENYFMEYLEVPSFSGYFLKSTCHIYSWEGLISKLEVNPGSKLSDKNLLVRYLEHFFLKGEKIGKYTKYLNNNFLKRVWEDTMLMAGREVKIDSENSKRLEKLVSEVRIKIQPNNKDCFKPKEVISLQVEIKNVPMLFIKVFEINLENYYRKTMNDFRSDINLDGLVASIERTLESKEAPQKRTNVEITFPELKDKVGLYVVELIGNGKSARAVIKIGSLSVITHETSAGQICYILDSERKVCCHESAGIWMDNTYYKADINKRGRIVIPYLPSESKKNTSAILLYQGMAQLTNFKRVGEDYSFRCGFYLLPESVIMGKVATIIVRPHLMINGRTTSLALLENIKCMLNTANYIEGIPATKTFNNLRLTDNGELIIKFNVGANIDSLSVTITAEVKNISKNKKQALSASHDFCINNHKTHDAIGEFYLQLNDKKDYNAYLLGKNGEPIKNASVTLTYESIFCQETKKISTETDEQGCISLGKMQNVSILKALYNQTSSTRVEKSWKLPSESIMQYPRYIDIIEGEDVVFPISLEDAKKTYLLRNVQGMMNIENFGKNVKIEQKEKELYKLVNIKGLKAGNYLLTGFDTNDISIYVHKGVYWKENERFILKDHSLLETTEKQGFVKIKSVECKEKEQAKAEMHIEVEGATKNQLRVHVLLFKYLPENLDELTLRLLAKDYTSSSEYFFQKWKNLYLSERDLGTEMRYCFDRRNKDRFIGNTLEKPKLVLKRNFLRSTRALEEVVTKGTKYESKPETRLDWAKKEGIREEKQKQKERGYYEMETYEKKKHVGRVSDSKPNADRIAVYQNFLALEPLVMCNLPGEGNKLIIELEEKARENYKCALVLAVDKGSVAHYLLPLPGTSLQKRDISHSTTLDTEKSYSEVRSTTCLEKYENYTINDITSTDFQLIDSLEKVALIIQILLKLDNIEIKHLNEFEKLLKWDTMKEEEKNKMVSRYGSHELNLFVYKKDPGYFKEVIEPYLTNKMEKTFIDYYLLEDFEVMLKYANTLELYNNMHYLEKALLIERLALGGKVDLARTIAERMKEWLLTLKKDLVRQNRIFNAVLSLGELETGKGKFEEQAKYTVIRDLCKKKYADTLAFPKGAKSKKKYANDKVDSELIKDDDMEEEDEVNDEDVELGMEECEKYSDFKDELEIRKAHKPALEELGETKEYCETNYYWYTGAFTNASFVTRTEFWIDYGMSFVEGKKFFLSSNFIYTCNNLTEIMAALAMLDLPFVSPEHGYRTTEGRSVELKAANNLIIFNKEVKETKEDISNNVLVAQKYVSTDNRNDDSKIEEFLVNRVYEGQVIITNISSKKLDFDLLIQIPQGALPLGSSPYQKSYPITLKEYVTTLKTYLFYFPNVGKYKHSPASVSMNSVVIAKAPTEVLNVVTEKTKISHENFRDVVSTGNYELIIKFLKDRPIEGIKEFNWDDVLWLAKDPEFFYPFIKLMKMQHRFEHTFWSYSLFHKGSEELVIDFLNAQKHLKRQCGYYFDSKLFTVRPIDSGIRHLDYYPLVNPRAHKNLANTIDNPQPMILNEQFYETYKAFILYLIEKPEWDLIDNMNLIHYLILQDRVTEAIQRFNKIKERPKETLKLQYDYTAAYLDFYTGAPEFKKAREIVAEYIKYPVLSWRLLFADIDQQLKEYDGVVIDEKMEIDEEERKERSQKKELESEAQLDISLDGKELVVVYNSIKTIKVKYYIIDLEILFSRTPFLAQNTEDFSFVQPNSSELIDLDPKAREHKVKIPENYSAKNVVIEVNGAGLQKLATHFSTTMIVQIFENYGELKVTDETEKVISKAYVKVFIRKKSGEISFYKDGYTDIRGRFDYVSLNASELAKTEKFALFIMSDEHGSLIRECLPPSTTIRPEGDVEPSKPRFANYY